MSSLTNPSAERGYAEARRGAQTAREADWVKVGLEEYKAMRAADLESELYIVRRACLDRVIFGPVRTNTELIRL
jgi:hypothetical protein